MGNLPLVSIVIPNYNGQDFLEGLFKSLAAQRFRDFEVIFVDNHSSDNSMEVLKDVLPGSCQISQ